MAPSLAGSLTVPGEPDEEQDGVIGTRGGAAVPSPSEVIEQQELPRTETAALAVGDGYLPFSREGQRELLSR